MAEANAAVKLEWRGLSYYIPDKKAPDGKKWILQPQDGEAAPGSLLALMGPSGSGKTSVLNALAGRLPPSKGACFSGKLKVNNVAKQELPCPFADISAYVEQEDVLYALSTAHETVDFCGRLRLKAGTDPAERSRRIEEVLRQLGLYEVRNTNVGGSSFNGALRGLSGGERKRLSIALELLHNPKLIFLDEPTSGLDSYQALNVMEKLRDLATAGHTVVVSIHQPRSSIFSMFTGIYLLANGRPVFAGSVDESLAHFAKCGHELPAKFNPADFLIDLVSIDQRDNAEQERTEKRLTALHAAWGAPLDRQVSEEATEAQKSSILAARSEKPAGQSAFFAPLVLLLKRGWREQMRDSTSIGIKVIFNAFFSMVFALVYFRMGRSQTNIQDRMGLLFFTTMNQAFGSVIGCSQVIPRQLVVVSRERANRLYSVLPFYVSCLMVMLPIECLPQLFANAILFFMTNLGGSFWVFFGIMVLENLVGISLGMWLSAIFKNVQMASQLAPAVVILFLMFGGNLINEDSVPIYFAWIKECSFIRYAFKAVAVNELEGSVFECGANDPVCVTTGEQVLEQLGFLEEGIIWKCAVLLIAIFVAFNILAFFTLLAKKPRFLELSEASAPAAAATPGEKYVETVSPDPAKGS
jgi:ABC-type multidrug transport system ATPase subunit